MTRRARAGFTLVELMVAVSIIGVLAAIAIPNLMGHVRKAKASQRTFEAREIENAAQRYFEDKQRWPTGSAGAATTLSSTWNPPVLNASATFNPSATDWKDLVVPLEGKTRFQYQLTGTASAAGVGGFVLTIRSDLDGNGINKVITRTFTLNKSNWGVTEAITGDLTE